MKNLLKWSFSLSLGILIYITIVAFLMTNGDRLFGEMDNFVGPISFLLLFTLSALVVGVLGLGKPIMLYLDGKKKEAITLLCAIVGWLGMFTIVALITATVIT